jgi:hypothetical protein
VWSDAHRSSWFPVVVDKGPSFCAGDMQVLFWFGQI